MQLPTAKPLQLTFPLTGPGGEPIDLWRTLISHGVTSLPPMFIDEDARTVEVTVPLDGLKPRTIKIEAGKSGFGVVSARNVPNTEKHRAAVLATARHILRLDADLSPFYTIAAKDNDLSWATSGAGRIARCPTVFEDVVKTICTTNCTWSATERMVNALVEQLGERAPGAPETGTHGRAFPTPEAMASKEESWYREVIRAGYRGRYFQALATSVTSGELDLEVFATASDDDLSDEEMAKQLLALPGVGPYAAAHIMMMLGRYDRLIFDSWTRPKFARLTGVESATDAEITARFAPYGRYAGLAFWLFLTRDWVESADTNGDS
jgi:3-methyladenine DNA glycosylase/8-oxoguanine DNA glycosylase